MRQPPRLLDQLRDALRTRHYSLRTEEAYVAWSRRFILFHEKRHPKDMGAPEVLQRDLEGRRPAGDPAAIRRGTAPASVVSPPFTGTRIDG